MRREILLAVAAGALGGMLLVAAWHQSFFGVMLGLMFSSMPLAMTLLGLGPAYLPLAVMSGSVTVMVMTGSFVLAALYVVIDAAPIVILSRIGWGWEKQAATGGASPPPAEGRGLGLAVVSLALAAVALMATGLLTVSTGTDGLEATLRTQLQELTAQIPMAGAGSGVDRNTLVAAMARILPSAAAWNWAFRAMLSAALGQMLLARDGFARWPAPAYRTIAVPGWYIGVFWLAAVAGGLAPGDAGFIAVNAAMVLALPLVLQGLAVVHVAIARLGYGRSALIAFYCVALVAAGAAIALIVILGVMEHFLQMRVRLSRRPHDGGE
jgi:hypothetical protein